MPRWLLSLLLLCLATQKTVAQTVWQAGGTLSVGLAKEWTVSNLNPWFGNAQTPTLPEWEYPRTGAAYSVWLSFYRSFGRFPHLFFETGFAFAHKRYNTYSFLSTRPLTVPPSPSTITDTLVTRIRASLFQFPLLIQWRMGRNPKWKALMTGGVVPGVVIDYRNINQTRRTPLPSFRREGLGASLGLQIGAGVYYEPNETHALLIEPAFVLDIPANDRTFLLKLTLIHDFFDKNR